MPRRDDPSSGHHHVTHNVVYLKRLPLAFIFVAGIITFFSNTNSDEPSHDGDLPRHKGRRSLSGDYIHVDVSDQFSELGKWSILVTYVVVFATRLVPVCNDRIGPAGVSLFGALFMVAHRAALRRLGHGPEFDVRRVVFLEPLCVVFGALLFAIDPTHLRQRGSLFERVRSFVNDRGPSSNARCLRLSLTSFFGSALFTNDTIATRLPLAVADGFAHAFALVTFANLGSALTMTGSSHNFLVATVAYDEIGWTEFLINMLAPVSVAALVNGVVVLLSLRFQSSSTNYASADSDLRLREEEEEEENNDDEEEAGGEKKSEDVITDGAFSIDDIDDGDPVSKLTADETPEEINDDVALRNDAASYKEKRVGSSVAVRPMLLALILVGYTLSLFTARLASACLIPVGAGLILLVISTRNVRGAEIAERNAQENNTVITRQNGDEKSEATNFKSAMTKVDFSVLLVLVGQFVVTGSLNDTGLPQAFFQRMLGQCAGEATNVPCVYRYVFVLAIMTNALSFRSSPYASGSLVTAQMVAATIPYQTPFGWLVTSFALSVSGNLSMFGSSGHGILVSRAAKVGNGSLTFARYAVPGLVSTVITLLAGTFVLSTFHTVPECSIKLGECDGFR